LLRIRKYWELYSRKEEITGSKVGVAVVTRTLRIRKFVKGVKSLLANVRNAVFGFVLTFFSSANKKIKSTLPFWRMEEETSEHVHMLVKVLKYVVLPMSLLYICADFVLFQENALDSMFWGILVFLYSNFLPDLPSVFRKSGKENEDLPWYKKYSLLLFAPLFIWLLLSGSRIGWKTAETFHNFRSLAVFGVFLFFLGFFFYGSFPIGIGNITEIFSLPLYGVTGFLSHLRVDGIL
jgi:hypothetical protein